jgi:hypothetical protein
MAKGDWGFATVDAFGESLDGTSGVRACTASGVVKTNSASSPYAVANEFICGRLAQALGLPCATGGVARLDTGAFAYVALRFSPKGESPPPADAKAFVEDHPKLALRVIVLDCWIANDDRHEGNLAYAREGIPPMVFDHDKALLGYGGLERFEELDERAILNGCLDGFVQDAAALGGVIDEVKWLSRHVVEDICEEAFRYGLMNLEERDGTIDFLKKRAEKLHRLMNKWPVVKKLGLDT